MTLSELKNRCDMAGIAYSYGSFEQSIQPPHLVGHVIDSDNFSADDMVYYTNSNFQLELTTLKKDLQLNKVKFYLMFIGKKTKRKLKMRGYLIPLIFLILRRNKNVKK